MKGSRKIFEGWQPIFLLPVSIYGVIRLTFDTIGLGGIGGILSALGIILVIITIFDSYPRYIERQTLARHGIHPPSSPEAKRAELDRRMKNPEYARKVEEIINANPLLSFDPLNDMDEEGNVTNPELLLTTEQRIMAHEMKNGAPDFEEFRKKQVE